MYWNRRHPLSNAEYDEVCHAVNAYDNAWANAKGLNLFHQVKRFFGIHSAKLEEAELKKTIRHMQKIAGLDSEHHRMLLWVASGRYESNKRTRRYKHLEAALDAI